MVRPSLLRRCSAELIGTYGLVTAGCGAIMVNSITGALGHAGVALDTMWGEPISVHL